MLRAGRYKNLPTPGPRFLPGDRVQTPQGAVGHVVDTTVHGNVRVRLEITELTFPWSPDDLVPAPRSDRRVLT